MDLRGFGILRKVNYDFHLSVESNWIGITSALHDCPIGLKNSRHFLIQSEVTLKPRTRFPALWVSHNLSYVIR